MLRSFVLRAGALVLLGLLTGCLPAPQPPPSMPCVSGDPRPQCAPCVEGDPRAGCSRPQEVVVRWTVDGQTAASSSCPSEGSVSVLLYPAGGFGFGRHASCVDGTITLSGVQPGQYSLEATLGYGDFSHRQVQTERLEIVVVPDPGPVGIDFCVGRACERGTSVAVQWTVNGQPASEASCPEGSRVEVTFGTRDGSRQWARRECVAGASTVLGVPPGSRLVSAHLSYFVDDIDNPDRFVGKERTVDVAPGQPPVAFNFCLPDRPCEPAPRDGGVDAGSERDVAVVDVPAPTDAVSPTDRGPVMDLPVADAGPAGCALRSLPGACTPGAPGCDIVDVAIGGSAESGPCAVFTDGSLRCWAQGRGTRVYLGNGLDTGCPNAGLVRDLGMVRQVRQGADFLCAARAGQPMPVWCWGSNAGGQFGARTPALALRPEATAIPQGSLVLGGQSGFSITAPGVVTAWGHNDHGQLGDGTIEAAGAVTGVAPHEVTLTGLQHLAMENGLGRTSCGVFAGGEVRCWGRGAGGQFGRARSVSASTRSLTPLTVPGITNAREVAVDAWFACALRTDATVWCWGIGDNARMAGAGASPTQVLDRATQVVLGPSLACVLRDDGTVWCWGAARQVGNGGLGDVPQPQQVRGLTGVRRLYAGAGTRCAWRGGADLRCWGASPGGVSGAASEVPVRVAWGEGCEPGTTLCSGTCIDLSVDDPMNCGFCGRLCTATQRCTRGVCEGVCGAGLTTCLLPTGAYACSTLQVDNEHCGRCGNACAPGQSCGRLCPFCVPQCHANCSGFSTFLCASGACIDPNTDRANCGGCGIACPAGQSCRSGACS